MHMSTRLTLHKATRVVLFEPNQKSIDESQCMDRAHCIGQTKQVLVYTFHCRGDDGFCSVLCFCCVLFDFLESKFPDIPYEMFAIYIGDT